MNWFRSAVLDNPMFAEMPRQARRFVSPSGSGAVNRLAVGCMIAAYLGFMTLVGESQMPFEGVVWVEMILAAILVAPVTHKAIAGERDRRSWDLLQVAPLRPEQIVVGRFVGAMIPFLTLAVLATMVAPFSTASNSFYADGYRYASPAISTVALSQVYVVSWSLCLVALGILISARSRRAFTALASTFGVLVIWLVVLPVLGSVVFDSFTWQIAEQLFPFTTLSSIFARTPDSQALTSPLAGALLMSTVYTIAGVSLLVWASKTLHFADNQVRFAGGRRHA
ncbi:MAG: ABC transporter permease [Fimbriimonadaceae bacterium]|nr:ABC transporter permease subunit [Chthonomonadaceae bacterium]MCO5296175.1 ABC transporter permease [Fimbriimonadaceae bacterium]